MDRKLNILERASNPSSVRIMGDVLDDDGEDQYNNPVDLLNDNEIMFRDVQVEPKEEKSKASKLSDFVR